MNISKPFVKRPVFTTLTIITLVVFGFLSYKKLPVSSLPQISFPVIQVTTNYPGASPEQIAKRISAPLERQFMLMQGIQFVASSNTYQTSTIVLQFHLDVDINIAAQETEQAIQKALAELPDNLPQDPVYVKFNPADTPIYYMVVYSPVVAPSQIYEYGYSFIGQQLGTVEGVADIEVYGSPYAVRVKADPQALAARNIGLDELANAINAGNPEQPTGKFYGPNKSVVTDCKGQLIRAKEYENLIIKYADNAPVRLKDVATVEESVQNDKQQFKWLTKEDREGQDLAFLAVYRQLGYNTVKVCDEIAQLIETLGAQLPQGLTYDNPFTLATWIKEAVADVELTLGVAFLLVVIVVYLYLGRIRNSIIPLITLPITIITTFIFMDLFGFNLDIMSLSALTLSIGFLVDDAIVVLENIARWGEQEHLDPYNAALKGAKQIILAVVSISLCLCAVFIPMLFMEGAMGELFHEFAAVIIIAVLVSGFVSLSLTPMLCSRFLAHYEIDKKTKMERVAEWFNQKLLNLYEPALAWTLKHRFWVLLISSLSVFLSIYLIAILPKEFLPPNDLGVIQSFVQAPEGTSPEKTQEYAMTYGKIALEHPAIKTAAVVSGTPTDNQSLLFLNLYESSKRADVWKVMNELQQNYNNVIGAQIFQKAFPLINLQIGGTEGGKANYQYVLQSFDETTLYQVAPQFVDIMRASPKLKNVNSNYQPNAPTLEVNLLRDQAHAYGGISATQIENAFMYAYGETYISKINVPQNMYYVILEVENDFQRDPQQLSSLYIANNSTEGLPKEQVYAQSVVDTKLISSPETVNHLNALTSVTISFDPADGVPLSEAIEEVKQLSQLHVPSTILPRFVGNTAAFEAAMKQFIFLIIIAIFVIYVIQGILYENFLYPITPLSSVPVALLGGILSLIIFRQNLSIYAIVGLIMLLGLVMKNGILIVDFALEIAEEEELTPYDAVFKACLLRFRPIIMTTIAAMMGALPIALGIGGTVAQGRAPLGIAVVGGLIFAQFVTLFLTPVVFIYIEQLNSWMKNRFGLFADKHEKERD